MRLFRYVAAPVAACCLLLGLSPAAVAETGQVNLSMQYGLGHLAMMVMKHEKLVEKQLKARGLNDTKVSWHQLTGSAAMNDALLSRSIDFTSGGITGIATLWAASGGRVKAIGAEDSLPMYLVTNNPKIKDLKDFTPADKIALPAVKVSPQAIVLEMAAQKEFGNYAKLDPNTVTMKHPDAMAALLSGGGGISAHFSFAPYQNEELRDSHIHRVLNSFDVLGGPATIVVSATRVEFYKKNPKTCQAVIAAMKEAIDLINHDKHKAAEIYKAVSKDKRNTLDQVVQILNSSDVKYSFTPHNSMAFVNFMYERGLLKKKPDSWKDLYFPDVHKLPGAS